MLSTQIRAAADLFTKGGKQLVAGQRNDYRTGRGVVGHCVLGALNAVGLPSGHETERWAAELLADKLGLRVYANEKDGYNLGGPHDGIGYVARWSNNKVDAGLGHEVIADLYRAADLLEADGK
jgi:hypothetical protein